MVRNMYIANYLLNNSEFTNNSINSISIFIYAFSDNFIRNY